MCVNYLHATHSLTLNRTRTAQTERAIGANKLWKWRARRTGAWCLLRQWNENQFFSVLLLPSEFTSFPIKIYNFSSFSSLVRLGFEMHTYRIGRAWGAFCAKGQCVQNEWKGDVRALGSNFGGTNCDRFVLFPFQLQHIYHSHFIDARARTLGKSVGLFAQRNELFAFLLPS